MYFNRVEVVSFHFIILTCTIELMPILRNCFGYLIIIRSRGEKKKQSVSPFPARPSAPKQTTFSLIFFCDFFQEIINLLGLRSSRVVVKKIF